MTSLPCVALRALAITLMNGNSTKEIVCIKDTCATTNACARTHVQVSTHCFVVAASFSSTSSDGSSPPV